MWYYMQCDLVVGWIWLLFLEELVRYLYGLTILLYIYFISDLHNSWAKRKNLSVYNELKQELSVFKSEFSSSFKKLRQLNSTVKLGDNNAQLDEIEKKHKQISYTGS